MLLTETIEKLPTPDLPWYEVVPWFDLIGSASGASVVLGLVIWLLKPRFEAMIRSMQSDTKEINRQLTTNGHQNNPPTTLDQMHTFGRRMTELHRKVDGNTQALDALREDFHRHETEGQRFLKQAVAQFAEQGVKLDIKRDD